MGFRIIGVDAQGFGVLRNGLLIFAKLTQSTSQVVMGFRIIGVDAQGFGVLRNGLLIFAQAIKSISQVVMRSVFVGRFLHTIGPEFYLAIPNSIPPIGSSAKEKDHKNINRNFYNCV